MIAFLFGLFHAAELTTSCVKAYHYYIDSTSILGELNIHLGTIVRTVSDNSVVFLCYLAFIPYKWSSNIYIHFTLFIIN